MSNKEEPRTHHHGLGTNRRSGPRSRAAAGANGDKASLSASRREFLQGAAITTAGVLAGSNLFTPEAGQGAPRTSPGAAGGRGGSRSTKVVRTYHAGATTGMTLNQGPVDAMVHLAVRELTGLTDTAQAWLSLFPGITTASKIGIKINLACGDVPTHPEVINAIIDGLLMMDLGGETLPEEHIIVYDHDHPFFCPQTGYTPNWGGPGVQYVGTSHGSVGYDLDFTFTLNHPLSTTTDHHPSSLITQHFDYMINAAVIKDHSDSDVTLCLKNHYGSFDGVSVYPLHVHYLYGDGHTRGEPGLNKILRDNLGDKTKLFLIDATLGLYDGGPGGV